MSAEQPNSDIDKANAVTGESRESVLGFVVGRVALMDDAKLGALATALGAPREIEQLTALSLVTETHVSTIEAAQHLSMKPQTLRGWALSGDGKVVPIRVGGQWRWPVAGIREAVIKKGASK